jgi:hypothetical protein
LHARQEEKVAGEVAQQPSEEQERELRLVLLWLGIFAGPLFLAFGLIVGSIEPSHLATHGYDLVDESFWLLPTEIGR